MIYKNKSRRMIITTNKYIDIVKNNFRHQIKRENDDIITEWKRLQTFRQIAAKVWKPALSRKLPTRDLQNLEFKGFRMRWMRLCYLYCCQTYCFSENIMKFVIFFK